MGTVRTVRALERDAGAVAPPAAQQRPFPEEVPLRERRDVLVVLLHQHLALGDDVEFPVGLVALADDGVPVLDDLGAQRLRQPCNKARKETQHAHSAAYITNNNVLWWQLMLMFCKYLLFYVDKLIC